MTSYTYLPPIIFCSKPTLLDSRTNARVRHARVYGSRFQLRRFPHGTSTDSHVDRANDRGKSHEEDDRARAAIGTRVDSVHRTRAVQPGRGEPEPGPDRRHAYGARPPRQKAGS